MFDFLKRSKEEKDLDKYINNLPLHPDFKKQAKGASFRLIKNSYDETDEGRTEKAKDYQIVRNATELAELSLLNQNKKNFSPFPNATPAAGYQPSGSILRKIYPEPFALHSFICESFWAAAKARKELWVEVDRDSYALISDEKVSKRDIKLINAVLQDLNIEYYRNKLRDTVLCCGTAVLMNEENRFGGLLKLNPLLMERLAPHYKPGTDELDGWVYYKNARQEFIPLGDTDYITTYNLRSNILGAPALGSVVVDIEAAMQASIYNNNVMQKGGLLSVVFRMRDPENEGFINDKISLSLADEFTKWLEQRFSGIRGSGQMAFLPMVEGIDVLNKIGEMDAAWGNLDDKTSVKTSMLLGVPPERIGVMRTSQYENKQLVNDSMSLSFDNNNYYVQRIVDNYLTDRIIKKGLGIDNVRIESSGEFSAISKTAAEVGKLIAELGADVMSVNQFRTQILHISPLEGPLGEEFLGHVTREALLQKNDNNLTKAIGQAKNILSSPYRDAQVQLVSHKKRYIPYY